MLRRLPQDDGRPWQSSTVVMIPPFRNPKPLSCSGRGVNSATVRSPSRWLRRWKPFGFACPQPKQVSSGYNDSWMLTPLVMVAVILPGVAHPPLTRVV